MQNARLDESKAGIKITGRNINNLRNADTTLMAESEEKLKSFDEGVREPITSWQIDGENVETVSDFIFLGSKINADGDCSHEIKRCLLFGRTAMSNLDTETLENLAVTGF